MKRSTIRVAERYLASDAARVAHRYLTAGDLPEEPELRPHLLPLRKTSGVGSKWDIKVPSSFVKKTRALARKVWDSGKIRPDMKGKKILDKWLQRNPEILTDGEVEDLWVALHDGVIQEGTMRSESSRSPGGKFDFTHYAKMQTKDIGHPGGKEFWGAFLKIVRL